MYTDQPEPYRTDGSNSFAFETMGKRLPGIIRSTSEENPGLPETAHRELNALAEAITSNERMPRLIPPTPDWELWRKFSRNRTDERWLDTEWFYGEHLVYRLILETVRYWETGADPFLPKKEKELVSGAPSATVEKFMETYTDSTEALKAALHASLWGNRIDLSYRTSADLGSSNSDESLVIIDHAEPVLDAILESAGSGKPVHIVTDNAGSEFTADLLLAYVLIRNFNIPAVFHVKFHPTYVSDATAADAARTVEYLKASSKKTVRDFGNDIARFFHQGLLRFLPDLYWNTPAFMKDLPERLKRPFSGGALVILKGDVNYRRAVGDAPWPPGTDPAQAVPGLSIPVLFLRALKSDTLTGVDDYTVRILDAEDPAWRNNGKRGIIQLTG